MKRFLIFFFTTLFALHGMAKIVAEGVIVYAEGNDVVYALQDIPTLKYDKGEVVLLVENVEMARFKVADKKDVMVVYAAYEATGVDTPDAKPSKVTRVGKVITGGRLIIIGKDGRKYDASGKEVK